MILTRKIQIYVNEDDKEQKKEFLKSLYQWRDMVRKGANLIVSHKFVQDNIRDFIYIKDEIKDKFYVKNLLNEGKGMSEQNVTYRVLSEIMKGQVPSDIYGSLNQAVGNSYKETKKDILCGNASLRSYRSNIPIPFSAKALSSLKWEEESGKFIFSLFGIPMACFLGRDRSNNKAVIERILNGSYKLCSSSIQIDDAKKKIFLLLCMDVPKKENDLDKDRILFANLSVETPIIAQIDKRVFQIGNKEEFLYRRIAIQQGLRRLQSACRYNTCGKGRMQKLKALERYRDKESNYVSTKLHQYSKMLVDLAVKNKCATIILVDQSEKIELAKKDDFLLRNWSYFGLETKIAYKAEMAGVKLTKD